MSDQPEPLAAILAEMRLEAGAQTNPSPLYRYADRIEAAAKYADAMCRKNEEAAFKRGQAAIGNAAAMREALDSIADIAKDAFGGPERHREASQGRALSLIVDKARAALAAPARNCDRFTTADDARDAAKKEFANTMLLDDRQLRAACDWLFAPAEGGDHA